MDILKKIKTPAYVVDIRLLRKNLEKAAYIRKKTGCKILLATKAFALPAIFPFMATYLDGTTANGFFQAKMGKKYFGKEVHVFSQTFTRKTMEGILPLADCIYFNSADQLRHFLPMIRKRKGNKKVGIRINPGYSHVTIGGNFYDPCGPRSRFGVSQKDLQNLPWDEIDILHAHTLCESRDDGSTNLIRHLANKFEPFIRRVEAVNFGGGHFIGKKNYNINALIDSINEFRRKFNVEVILEPGSGLVVDAGYLVATVLEKTRNNYGHNFAILDASAPCHLPDILEPNAAPVKVLGASKPGKYPNKYLLAGNTCMTGDIFGEFSFPKPLKIGDKIAFCDALQYSFTENNTFDGAPLPDIGLLKENGKYKVIKTFSYNDFIKKLK